MISKEEWLAELERLQVQRPPADEGMTTQEIAVAINHSTKWVIANLLRPAAAAGRLHIGRKTITRLDGKVCPVPVYRLT